MAVADATVMVYIITVYSYLLYGVYSMSGCIIESILQTVAGSVFRLKFGLFLGQCDLLFNTKICVKDVRNFLHTIPVCVHLF